MFSEYIAIDNRTRKAELRELTEVMAQNLSEVATVMSVNFLSGKATIWRNRVARVESIDRGTLMELMRRIVWRDEHVGLLS